jgi:hypothetical protein
VGNSGNARTTPPHLHFGIYRRGEGPTDPDPWLRLWEPTVAEVSADTAALGALMRVAVGSAALDRPARRSEAAELEPAAGDIPARTLLRVLAAAGDRYRVGLPDGGVGYVRARDLEYASEPLGTAALGGLALRAGPAPDAPVIATPAADHAGDILGVFGEQAFVRGPGGVEGWSALAAPE